MAEAKIKIKNLYKIFGNKPDQVMPLVRQGVSKQELLDEHKHVLGLSDINIDIPAKRIHVIMGLSGSCLLYTSPSPRDRQKSRMPSSA